MLSVTDRSPGMAFCLPQGAYRMSLSGGGRPLILKTSDAIALLDDAKGSVKVVLIGLDPSPTEPVATQLLAILDAIDAARRSLIVRADPKLTAFFDPMSEEGA